MSILEKLKSKRLYCDGGMGTILQGLGLKSGDEPAEWSLTHPDEITNIHKAYFEAGASIVNANTFGVTPLKFKDFDKYIKAAVDCAKKAREGFSDRYVALDIGPTGRLLKPLGDLEFDDAVSAFAETVKCGVECGVDLILIETMNDLYETKAAVLAAKENSNLPVFVTNAYGEDGKLMTGADPDAVISTLAGLGVDAIGINCSYGPDKMLPVIEKYCELSPLPVIVNPNAGMPEIKDGKTVFNIGPEDFAEKMTEIAKMGASVLGGCCGTTPKHIEATVKATKDIAVKQREVKKRTVISSYTHTVEFGEKPILIGERINPTGKKLIKQALREKNYNFILNEGINQADRGCQILDINAGLPEIDEAEALSQITNLLQSVTDLPLQIDTTNPKALEKALRLYNGKPLINSVNGTKESMASVFPLQKKYGGVIIALTIGENGIPETAEGRLEVAKHIIETAEEYGIDRSDIIVDPLAMTVSSDPKSALVTLKAIKLIKENLGVKTSLGVSNISFGLPERDKINSAFFTMAMQQGLDAAIMNPFSDAMLSAYYSYLALTDKDERFEGFIGFAESLTPTEIKKPEIDKTDLKAAIIKGLGDSAEAAARELLKTVDPLEVINSFIVPALDEIGKAFEQKTAYLPQLLMAAEASAKAFCVIKEKLPADSADKTKKIVIATVKGDIHDIGKNIVKVLLENYGFYVVDLGRDVAPEAVVEAAKDCRLVGLSALMTTTVPAMEETVKLLHEAYPDIKVVVGGAVLTQSYATMIGADFYGKDAMDTVRIAQKTFE